MEPKLDPHVSISLSAFANVGRNTMPKQKTAEMAKTKRKQQNNKQLDKAIHGVWQRRLERAQRADNGKNKKIKHNLK